MFNFDVGTDQQILPQNLYNKITPCYKITDCYKITLCKKITTCCNYSDMEHDVSEKMDMKPE